METRQKNSSAVDRSRQYAAPPVSQQANRRRVALRVSVACFLTIGAWWIVIGALTVPMHDSRIGSAVMPASPSVDAVIAGFLLLSGSLFVLVTWFALRRTQVWALVALSTSAFFAVAWWTIALLHSVQMGVRLALLDVPPFIWMPAILLIPATALGMLGIRSSRDVD